MKINKLYDKAELFHNTIQGEGRWIGRPAAFVRLWGCNLKCWFCDSADSWNKKSELYEGIVEYTTNEAAERMVAGLKDGDLVVITGGEPLLQQKEAFEFIDACGKLIDERGLTNIDFQFETNGEIPIKETSKWLMERNQPLYVSSSPKLVFSANRGYVNKRGIRLAQSSTFNKLIIDYKFVINTKEALIEANQALENTYNGKFYHKHERLFAMPLGITDEDINYHLGVIADMLEDPEFKGWGVSDRLHIRMFGAKRGV